MRQRYTIGSVGRSRNRMVAAAVLLAAGQVWAGNAAWEAAVDGFFDSGGKWTDGTAPSELDSVRFNREGTYNVWWDDVTGDRTTMDLSLSAGNVTVGVATSSQRAWTIHDSLNQADARVNGGSLTLGQRSGFTGTLVLTVDDALAVDDGGSLNVLLGGEITAAQTQIGVNGAGRMAIQGGGRVNSQYAIVAMSSASGASSSVMVDGEGSTWSNEENLVVGNLGAGDLWVSAGGRVFNRTGYINFESAGHSSVTVSGAGSKWDNSQNLEVGYGGSGALTIDRGGRVESAAATLGNAAGAVGTVTVTGADSRWTSPGVLIVGKAGDGTLEVSNGGAVSFGDTNLGLEAGSSGTVTVDGAGSKWTSSSLCVGYNGSGTLQVSNGGRMSSTQSEVAKQPGSTGNVTMDGAGSEWTNSDFVTIGAGGSGTVTVTRGAQVTTRGTTLGSLVGSDGHLSVAGAGSSWDDSGHWIFRVGDQGKGSLTILGGGKVTGTQVSVAGLEGSSGRVTVDGAGSSLTSTMDLDIGWGGSGELVVVNGAQVTNGNSMLGFDRGSSGDACVTGAAAKWTVLNDLSVGVAGQGSLLINNGGEVTTGGGCYVGQGDGSLGSVVVDGTGVWNASKLQVGFAGFGSVSVTNGGLVSSTEGSIGVLGGSVGSVTVDGDGSKWTNSGAVGIGGSPTKGRGVGSVFVGSGAELEVGQTLSIWTDGTLDLAGGTLRLHTPNAIGFSGGAFNYYMGTVAYDCDVTIGAGRSQVTNAALFGANPSIPVGKTLEINGKATLLTPLAINGGTFSVGSLANGSLLQFNSGTLQLTASDLTVGTGGQFGDTLELGSGRHVQVAQNAFVQREGLLVVNDGASLDFLNMDNQGEIELAGRNARLNGTSLGNSGVLQGQGRISAALSNFSRGEVRVGPGQRMFFTNPQSFNYGAMVVDHGQLDFLWSLSSMETSSIDVSGDSTITFQNGMVSEGAMNFDGGPSRVYGFVHNGHLGQVSVGGAGRVSFFGGFRNSGVVTVGTNATASFYGDITGAGSYGGSGITEFLGTFSPGNSPAQVQLGNAAFASTNTLIMELGGTTPGAGYDQLVISGTANLDGTLHVVLLDGYAPALGDGFALITGGTMNGSFRSVELPVLANGLDWTMAKNSSGVTLQVVPEPMAIGGMALVTSGLLIRRQRASVDPRRSRR